MRYWTRCKRRNLTYCQVYIDMLKIEQDSEEDATGKFVSLFSAMFDKDKRLDEVRLAHIARHKDRPE